MAYEVVNLLQKVTILERKHGLEMGGYINSNIKH